MEVSGDVVNLVSIGNTGLKVHFYVVKDSFGIFQAPKNTYVTFKEDSQFVHSLNQCYHGFNQIGPDGMRKHFLFFFAKPIQV